MPEANELVMRFDPNTIEHLGVKMYSRIPTAIAELIANAYDADATEVTVTLIGGDDKKIIVKDNGIGMSFEEINSLFLRIGRNRRNEGQIKSASGTRVATGKKGLGKLALFGIGNTIEITTIKDNELVSFRLNWDSLKECHTENYKPDVLAHDKCKEASGTIITLSELKRKSDFNEKALAVSLSKLFVLFDANFKVFVKKEENQIEVNNELRYEELDQEFIFKFPDYVERIKATYNHCKEIDGNIITTEKPLKPGLRGITLFANGRLVNAPEFFGRSESSHFFSYLTGWLAVDFVDNWDEDVISTNRQSLNWDLDSTILLQNYLQEALKQIQKDWRIKRKEKRKKYISKKTKINIQDWYDNLPSDIQPKIERIVNHVDESELQEDDQADLLKNMHEIVPEYPYYHWRHLHSDAQDASKEDYQNEAYYDAFIEAAKRYINSVKSKSGCTNSSERSLMGDAFGINSALNVTENYRKPSGEPFDSLTVQNIEEGQKFLSMGMVAGGRNPLSHEEHRDLNESGLFNEKDCLDMLSILSHLFRRLDDAVGGSP